MVPMIIISVWENKDVHPPWQLIRVENGLKRFEVGVLVGLEYCDGEVCRGVLLHFCVCHPFLCVYQDFFFFLFLLLQDGRGLQSQVETDDKENTRCVSKLCISTMQLILKMCIYQQQQQLQASAQIPWDPLRFVVERLTLLGFQLLREISLCKICSFFLRKSNF